MDFGKRPGNINRRGKSVTKLRVSMTIDDRLVSKIDAERGLIPRSAFVQRILERTMSERMT